MNSKWLLGAVAVTVVVLVGGFLLLGRSKTATAPAPSPTTEASTPVPSTTPSTSPSAMTNNIAITGTEFSFAPSTVTVKKGEKVSLTFKNNGTFTHNLTIADLNVATKNIQPGEADTVEFTADKTGSFQFVCTIDSHKDKGMVGVLKVE